MDEGTSRAEDEQEREGRRRLDSFYVGDSAWAARGAQLSRDTWAEAAADELARSRARLLAVLRRRADDPTLLLHGIESLLRAEAPERRLFGRDSTKLRDNLRAVLDSFGPEILPPDDPHL